MLFLVGVFCCLFVCLAEGLGRKTNYVLQRVWGARDIMSCRGAGAQDSLCLAQGLGKAGPKLINLRIFGASAGEALNSLTSNSTFTTNKLFSASGWPGPNLVNV